MIFYNRIGAVFKSTARCSERAAFLESEEPFSHKIISLRRCLFLRYIPKRYYKHIFSASLQLRRQRTKKSFWHFYVYFVWQERGGCCEDHRTQHGIIKSSSWWPSKSSSLGKFSPPYACKLLTSEAENRRSGNSTADLLQSPQNLKVESRDEHFGAFSVPFWHPCSLWRVSGDCKKFGMLNHRLADTINIPVVTCDVVHSVRQFGLPRK